MSDQSIILVSCGLFEKKLTERVAENVTRELHFPVELMECSLDISDFYNPVRRQYDADELLRMITERAPAEAVRVIGMARVDLYIPILTYIFGQAHLNGRTGVVSIFRLRNEHYGLKPDYELLIGRFTKVIIHELGHTFGLIHCSHPACVMRSSTYVEDLEQKEHRFCMVCREEYNRAAALSRSRIR